MKNIYEKIAIITNELNSKQLTADKKSGSVKYDFKYLSLEGIYKHLIPLLKEYNIAMTFSVNLDFQTSHLIELRIIDADGKKSIQEQLTKIKDEMSVQEKSKLMINSSSYLTVRLPLIIDTNLQKDRLKALGSAITYTKRYLLGMAFNLNVCKDHEDLKDHENSFKPKLDVKQAAFVDENKNIVCEMCGGPLDIQNKFKRDDGISIAPCFKCKKINGKSV